MPKKEGFEDLKNLFAGHFDSHLINHDKIVKNIGRFKAINADWGRRARNVKNNYYAAFHPKNWIKMDESDKKKHNLSCNECAQSFSELQATFPCTSNRYAKENMKNPNNVNHRCIIFSGT